MICGIIAISKSVILLSLWVICGIIVINKSIIILLEGYFLYNRKIFDFVDKFSPVSNMAYSCLKKMLDFIILFT